MKKHLLVAVVLEVLLVAVVLKYVLWVVFPEPFGFVDVERAGLGLNLLPLPAPWDWGRQTWWNKARLTRRYSSELAIGL